MFTIGTAEMAQIWEVVTMIWTSFDVLILSIVGTLLGVTVIEMLIGAIRNKH